MTTFRTTLGAAIAASLLAGPALAHDCAGRIDDFERLLDLAAKEAISASSSGQAVAGAREAQAVQDSGAVSDTEETGTAPDADGEEPVVPVQDEVEEAAAVEEADESGNAGENVIDARTALQEAREMAEEGDEAACTEALDEVIVKVIAN
ncbi:hypothetical protein O4G76_05775 [Limimaricola sp. G21655-S1]|uniref:hypothetical protein n=1 Tax=unclassified Limimaricola TaxID=2626459 RepID=UPI0022AF6492|nr:hypothetical protein [Limimaricola sp. G21655-S1]MCZ4260350.1 hypothetical protein [Limimaricola sp. G21655-S1]